MSESAHARTPLPPPPRQPASSAKERRTVPTSVRAGRPPAWPAVPGYQIVGLLGQGGMGTVYEAWQVGLKRRVALKMLPPGAYDPEQRQRFRVVAHRQAEPAQVGDVERNGRRRRPPRPRQRRLVLRPGLVVAPLHRQRHRDGVHRLDGPGPIGRPGPFVQFEGPAVARQRFVEAAV